MRDLSTTLQEELGNWYSKKEICDSCGTDEKTFRRFLEENRLDIDVQSKIRTLAHNKKLYNEDVLKQFQLWLMRNQANQGKSSQVVKQATMDNLEIGVAANAVMSSGSIEAAEQFAQLLISRTAAVAENKQLHATNNQLQLENKQLLNENDYLKKTNELSQLQLGYYKNKYHSWQDDYENY